MSRDAFEKWGIVYARVALGTGFLSAVASRLGIWDGSFDVRSHFTNFIRRVGEVNSFMPAFTIPLLAYCATIAETALGILLILGLWPRWVALGSGVLLAWFAVAMTISFGIKEPLDYSVFSASGAGMLLALHAFGRSKDKQ